VKGKLICSPKRGFLRDTQEPFKTRKLYEKCPNFSVEGAMRSISPSTLALLPLK